MNYASFISWGILSVSAMSEETAFISFFLQEALYYCKNIYKLLLFFKCMHKLCKIYLHEIFCRVKFHAFLQRVKGYFLFFQNVILYFCPFKRDTTIINSFSLYRCENLLRYYRFISIWWISYNFQIYLTLYLILVSANGFSFQSCYKQQLETF